MLQKLTWTTRTAVETVLLKGVPINTLKTSVSSSPHGKGAGHDGRPSSSSRLDVPCPSTAAFFCLAGGLTFTLQYGYVCPKSLPHHLFSRGAGGDHVCTAASPWWPPGPADAGRRCHQPNVWLWRKGCSSAGTSSSCRSQPCM